MYARLYYLVSGVWNYVDSTYTTPNAGAVAAITSPADNSALTGSTVTFNWNTGTNSQGYWLDIGSSAGANNYYLGCPFTSTFSATAAGLPTNGSTVYATLYTMYGRYLDSQSLHLHRVQHRGVDGGFDHTDAGVDLD